MVKLTIFFSFFSVKAVQGNTLVMHHVTRTQMGEYECIANNGHPPAISRKVDLRVNCELQNKLKKLNNVLTHIYFLIVRPVIRVREPTIHQREGEVTILECIIESFPRGYIFWENNLGNKNAHNLKT